MHEAKKILKDIKRKQNNIKRLTRDIERLREQEAPVRTSEISPTKVVTSKYNPHEQKLVNMITLVEHKQKQIMNLVMEIDRELDIIYSLQEPYATMLDLRYIQGQPMKVVAYEVGYGKTQANVLMNQALDNFLKRYKEQIKST